MAEEPFRKLEFLGSGGFGETWLVEVLDKELRQKYRVSRCVIKIAHKTKSPKEIVKEAQANATLQKQFEGTPANLVRYLGYTYFEGNIVMAMAYVPDGSLRDRIGGIGYQRRLPLTEALDITERILEALVLIHSQHVIHRDIKPENLMFDGEVLKLCDLGLATTLSPGEVALSFHGALPYMAPEIYDEKGATPASDIWSVGVCLYEMLTGCLPFGGSNMGLLRMAQIIREASYEKAHEACPDIPKEVSALISKALEKEPSQRFNSAAEMLSRLRQVQVHEDPLKNEVAALAEQMRKPGQIAAVEARLLQLSRLFPDDIRIYRLLGELYNRCQRYLDAIATFNKGLDRDPENVLLHWDLFLSYEKIRKPREARATLDKATQLGLDASLQRYGEILLEALANDKNKA